MTQCTAKAKGTGQQCTKPAIEGTTKCRFHGGLSLKGPASPSFKHGRYSKYLPQNLLMKYEQSANDPDILAMREEISLTDARLSNLLEQLDRGGGMEDWGRVLAGWDRYLAIRRQMNNAATQEEADRLREPLSASIRDLDQVIRGGHRNISLWHEIHETVENRRRLVSTESKRLVDMQQMITSEKAIGFAYALLDIMKTRITDARLLSAISQDVRGLLTRTDSK